MPITYWNSVNKIIGKTKRTGLHIVILDFTEVTPNLGLERGKGCVYGRRAHPCSYKEEKDIQVSVKGCTVPTTEADAIHICCAPMCIVYSFLRDLADGDNGFIGCCLWQWGKWDSMFITENIKLLLSQSRSPNQVFLYQDSKESHNKYKYL